MFLGQFLLRITAIDRFLKKVLSNKAVKLSVNLEF